MEATGVLELDFQFSYSLLRCVVVWRYFRVSEEIGDIITTFILNVVNLSFRQDRFSSMSLSSPFRYWHSRSKCARQTWWLRKCSVKYALWWSVTAVILSRDSPKRSSSSCPLRLLQRNTFENRWSALFRSSQAVYCSME